jgi:hypothetical protein
LVAFFFRNLGRHSSWYSRRAVSAASATGTTRSFPPFPITRRNPALASTFSILKPTSSEARKPAAYRSRSIARSRIPSGVPRSGAERRLSTSVTVRYLGRGRPTKGARTSDMGLAGRTPSRTRNLKKERTEESCRATLREESPRSDVRN